MNREIKFRAWDKEEKKFVLYFDLSQNPMIWSDKMKDDYVITQYTGLRDKNGVEIYESDIVTGEYDNLMVDYSVKGVVEMGLTYDSDGWANEQTYGWVSTHKDDDTSSLLDLVEYNGCEVIGNIYENPDLLNK